MRVALIGRTEMLYNTGRIFVSSGFEIPLVVTAKAAPEYSRGAEDFAEFARELNAEFINTARINDDAVVDQIRSLSEIDIAVSVNYVNVISQRVIDIFRLGILNAHSGDLPRYRGNACHAWAILNGEERIGLCIHKMEGGKLDSGDIIAREFLPIDINTRIGETHDWMAERVPSLMLRAVESLASDPNYALECQSKDPQKALRGYPRLPEDGRIDWNATSSSIVRLVNASSEPYGGAFTELDGVRLTIWRAELADDDERFLAVPGQVAGFGPDGSVTVIAQSGKVRLLSAEFQGERGAPRNFIRSIRKRLK